MIGIELAEATAEWIHQRIRSEWGYKDRGDLTIQDLFAVLKPEKASVTLTEGMMMSPEGSVSAVVFRHPDVSYYSI